MTLKNAQAVKLSLELVQSAKARAKAEHRSMAGQIEYWAKIGKIAEENPDLPYEFIRGVLIAEEEIAAGKAIPFTFE